MQLYMLVKCLVCNNICCIMCLGHILYIFSLCQKQTFNSCSGYHSQYNESSLGLCVTANLTPCKIKPHLFPKCPLIVHYHWKEYSLPCSLHMSILKSSHKRATHTIFLFCSWSSRNTHCLPSLSQNTHSPFHSLPYTHCTLAFTLTQHTVLYSQYKARRQVLD